MMNDEAGLIHCLIDSMNKWINESILSVHHSAFIVHRFL